MTQAVLHSDADVCGVVFRARMVEIDEPNH